MDLAVLGVKIDTADVTRGQRALADFERQGARTERGISGAARSMARRLGSLTSTIFSLKSALVGLGVGAIAGNFIAAASEAERYRIRLNALTRSTQEGARMFKEMSEFAARVPFEYREIMGAATKLTGVMNGSVDEVKRWMPIIADLAAVSGLTIEQTADQIGRMFSAGAGAADLFRERGITAMLGFQSGATYSIEETRKKIIEAFNDVNSQFRGAAGAMAESWDGQLSMLSDRFFKFKLDVMNAAPFDYLKEAAALATKALGENADETDALAKRIGQSIVEYTKSFAIGTAGMLDAITPSARAIGAIINDMIDSWNSLPTWAKEVGIVGILFGGKQGALGLMLMAKAAEDTKMTAQWLAAYQSGHISFTEWISGSEEAKNRLLELGLLIENYEPQGGSLLAKIAGTEEEHEGYKERVIALFDEIEANIAKRKADAEGQIKKIAVSGGAGKPEEITAAEKQRRASIQQIIKALEWQDHVLANVGESEEILRLKALGATEAEIKLARSFIATSQAAEKKNQALAEGQRIIEATRTPLERYNATIAKLNDLLWAGAFGAVDSSEAWDTYTRAVKQAQEELDRATKSTTLTLEEMARRAGQNIQDAFADFLFDPFKDGLDGMLRDFVYTLHKMASQALAAKIALEIGEWGASNSDRSGAVGLVASLVSSMFGGGRASGGPVSRGKIYEVNERGPELLEIGNRQYLMMGQQSGNVVPNSEAGAMQGGRNIINIRIVNPPSTEAIEEWAGSDAFEQVFVNTAKKNQTLFRSFQA